ncbi:MAG TPA: phosphoribosylformylglycinamidine synthase subunit PurL, partial [Planctomycetota bacterium]|nr:phosphoribosylformylglycinamidine synthase subunit PurL [Planctomycetota bacterium]
GPVRPDEERLPVLTVLRRPGVMDPVEGSVREALRDLGIEALSVRTGRRFVVEGGVEPGAAAAAAGRALANEVVEEVHRGVSLPVRVPHPAAYAFRRVEVPLRGADDAALERISREGGLSLEVFEMQAIRDHFDRLGREPTDAELETLAQTWSEHCKHKTLTGAVRMRDPDGERRYSNLLKETVFLATATLNRPWCLSVFKDNAGVIALDDRHAVCMKVETHNHPSALEPYGGAGTGVGGVIRDVLGTGLGARPFLGTDVFCLAPPDLPADRVPAGALPPRRVLRGVVAGVRDYGNRMGIPTASGALWFDERFVGNPLVFCGTVGLLPRDRVEKAPRPGDRVVVVGGRTGRDGIHGATFSSAKLTRDSERLDAGAVQIGNPIEEKRVLDGLLRARDESLYTAVTDCGAGGLSSAVGEMAEGLGATVDLDLVPTKYPGLSYAEVWISEAQERMVLSVPPDRLRRLREVFAAEGVEVTDLGSFEATGRLRLRWEGTEVADLDLEFLHRGLPRREREASWTPPPDGGPAPEPDDHGTELRALLSDWAVCSREPVIRQYDHEVQGNSALKPFAGARGVGPQDAVAAVPLETAPRGVVVACGLNPGLSDHDPRAMAEAAIDEALRNAVSVGADPDRIALLDNFCWADARRPEELGALVRAAEACRDLSIAFGTPWISGKDSLHNEFDAEGRRIAIPGTLLVTALAPIEDAARLVSMDLKASGSALYLVGATRDERGGGLAARRRGSRGGAVPRCRPEESLRVFRGMHRAIRDGLVLACHDLSDGGLAVAAAEMCLAGDRGAILRLTSVPYEGATVTDGALLHSESMGRFLVEVAPDRSAAFEAATAGLPRARVGETTADGRLRVQGLRGAPLLDEGVDGLREAFLRRLPA